MKSVKFINEEEIHSVLRYEELIAGLRDAFATDIKVPRRHHHDYHNPAESNDSTLLLMPAWKEGNDLGVKVVTISPSNHKYDLPAIHGLYLLFNAHNGQPEAVLDARALTTRRTAATSALASSFLSAEDSKSLLMIGTGALAPQLIRAHCTVRPIEKVYIWGRNHQKAIDLARTFQAEPFTVEAVRDRGKWLDKVDIISCATLSTSPLVEGDKLREGTHVDLVGAYRKDMREADNKVMTRSIIYVDSREFAPEETGDLWIPLQEGVIGREDIRGDLFELCRGKVTGRAGADQITLFKSVGHALEDLVGARIILEKLNQK